ncbi:ClpX C4-type zinc finger protein [Pseudonocardia hispaniensis]|uniref:ClpX C4-type zinc finger protein n=1 Tax=Pseudonocardia hispaniensis TaxID=904933 RepID=A0ABW1J0H2_9PSEU
MTGAPAFVSHGSCCRLISTVADRGRCPTRMSRMVRMLTASACGGSGSRARRRPRTGAPWSSARSLGLMRLATLRIRRKRPWAVPLTRCSFCGQRAEQAGRLFPGPGVFICAGCAQRAADALVHA